MRQWTVKPGYYADYLDDHFLHEGIPVLVHSMGVYPELISATGESSHDTPHFTITYQTRTVYRRKEGTAETTYGEIVVNGYYPPGMRLTLWEKALPGVSDIAPFIEEARQHLDGEALDAIPRRYADARARIAQAEAYPDSLSREAYEQACDALDVAAMPDAKCQGRGVFSYPSYDAEVVLATRMADKRCRGIKTEQVAMSPPASLREPEEIRPQGQLWEPCEACGREPVYLPLHRCLDCWPKRPVSRP